MSHLEISQITDAGERRWGLTLVSDEGAHILRSLTPLAKGETLSVAKTLKHQGPDAPLLELEKEGPGEPNRPAWNPDRTSRDWSIRFTLVLGTSFDLLLRPEDLRGAGRNIGKAVEVVKRSLLKAEIRWNPPEADPAYEVKESDVTETTGIPGS